MSALNFLLYLALLQNSPSITSVGIDQKLGATIDPAIPFVDESGQNVTIGTYLGKRPIILTPVYYECPMLCSVALNGLVKALRGIPLIAGKEFGVVTFSFDPNERPSLADAKRRQYLREYGRSEAENGWHFLTGTRQSIEELTGEIGFRFMYDTHTQQWAHVSSLIVLTRDGHVSRYFYGIGYDPKALRLSLVEASGNSIGKTVEHVLLYCFNYDSATGKYTLAITRVLRAVALFTLSALASLIIVGARRRRAAHRI